MNAVTGSRLAGLRLLLVEDNYLNQQVACELLQAEGASVQVANDGAEGLACVLREGAASRSAGCGYDLVLMDMQMPVMDGYEATRRLRALGHVRLPIVALTAHVQEAERDECRAAGVDDFIAKPIEFEELIGTVAHHCRERLSR